MDECEPESAQSSEQRRPGDPGEWSADDVSWLFSGSPVVVIMSIAPMQKAVPAEPMAIAQVQNDRQACVCPLPRYSIDTARKIRLTSASVSGM